MKRLSICALAACILSIPAADAFGQAAPPAVPEAMPNDIPYGRHITLERARQVADLAMAEARRRNWKLAISIVDANGDLVYFQRMDSTQLASSDVATRKARTAVRFRRPTSAFFNQLESGHPYVLTLDPDLVGSPGGRPLMEGGAIVGGVGVSGAAGIQDDLVAGVAAEAMGSAPAAKR